MAMDLNSSFTVYRSWLREIMPTLVDELRGPAEDAELDRYEQVVGAVLPAELRQLWKIHDGEVDPDPAGGVIGGLVLLGVEASLSEWSEWASLRAETSDENLRKLGSLSESVPPDAVRLEYSIAGWLPILRESMQGNYLGLDLDPGPRGTFGQVISFGRDEDRKIVVARSLTDLLAFIVSEVEKGEFVVSSLQPTGEPVLTHRRGRLISVLGKLAEASGPLT